jgi:hypothetical protein
MPSWSLAQESTSANIIGVGPSNILDTYITQEKFSGIGLTYLYIKERAKSEKRWNNVIEHEIDFSSTKDRSKDNQMLEGNYNLYWGRYRHWQFCGDRLQLKAGALVNANLGFLYNMSTSNNPAQARISANIMPAAIATYRFPLFRQQWALRYELNVPLAGVMFSPNYGQSYYEIFSRGNYDHNIVPTTFIAAPTLRQQFTVQYNVSTNMALSLGYLGDYQQAKVNNLKSHIYSHRVMIGFVRRFSIIPHRL